MTYVNYKNYAYDYSVRTDGKVNVWRCFPATDWFGGWLGYVGWEVRDRHDEDLYNYDYPKWVLVHVASNLSEAKAHQHSKRIPSWTGGAA